MNRESYEAEIKEQGMLANEAAAGEAEAMAEQIEKPLVLSLLRCYSTIFNNTRQDYLNKHMGEDGIDHGGHTMEAATAEACKAVATAQRDADVAYYEPHVEFYKSAYELTMKAAKSLKERQDSRIQQAKIKEREKVLDETQAGAVSVAGLIERAKAEVAREISEEIEAQINKLTERSNELDTQRQPIIKAMGIRDWTPEEDEFMYSSVREIIEIPNRIAVLNNLKQFLESKYLKEEK